MMGLTPSEYRCARGWNFDILQPSFLLSEHETPELEVCYLDETFIYTHEFIEHDHLLIPQCMILLKKSKAPDRKPP